LLRLGKDVKIHETAKINVEDGFIGDRSVICAHTAIEGRYIRIGSEAWIDEYAYIGGGSCFDPTSSLEVGDFLHMGRFSHLNPGRGIKIGHEFGCGINTKIFTHGAYESAWEGFPVQWGSVEIGDRVWLPNAWVNPGVRIGNDVVVAAMSVVTKDIPDGCFAGGVPCKIIKENVFPKKLTEEEKGHLFNTIFSDAIEIYLAKQSEGSEKPAYRRIDEDTFSIGKTVFYLQKRRIEGSATDFSEILRNQLRRNGIRFRYRNENGEYVKW